MKILSAIAATLLCLCFTQNATFAQTNENIVFAPELFDGLKYRNVGPTRGGRATAVAGIPGQPFTFFFGSTGGGVWKTDDAGTTWDNISDGQIEAGSIGAITVAPSDPNTIYVGTGYRHVQIERRR